MKRTDIVRHWPTNNKGEAMFKSEWEARAYAVLIAKDPERQKDIKDYLDTARRELAYLAWKEDISLNHLYVLVTKITYFEIIIMQIEKVGKEAPHGK